MGTASVTDGIDLDAIATRQDFAAALTTVREAAGLTVRQVARATGIHPSTVGGYYSGRHLPPLRPDGGVRAILRACGVAESAELDAWQRTLARIRRAPGPRPAALPPPHRGLRAYGPEDASRFHGREEETRMLYRRVVGTRNTGGMTVLLGDVAIGKSSLLAAGLVPRLRAMPSDRPVVVLVPGRHPLRALAAALADLIGADPTDTLTRLEQSPGAARDLVERALPARDQRRISLTQVPDGGTDGGADEPLGVEPTPAIVVDQLEDLFAHCLDDDERAAFVSGLASTCRLGPRGEPAPAVVVVALRSSFLSQAAGQPDLMSALHAPAGGTGTAARTMVLQPLTSEHLRTAVLGAARSGGLDLEDGLVERILADAESVPELVLPRLGHTLARAWRGGQRARLGLTGYADAGGLAGAVETAAEAAYLGLDDGARVAARDLFTRLLVMTPGGVVAALGVPGDPTDAAEAAAARAFTELGLLWSADGQLRATTGCLPQLWPRLQDWLTVPAPQDGAPAETPQLEAAPMSPASALVPALASAATTPPAPASALARSPAGSGPDRRAPDGSAWRWVLAALLVSALLAGVAYELWR